ncbi:MAG: Fe-S protein assembly co-chaperone HscB [Acidobacteriota bacterium]
MSEHVQAVDKHTCWHCGAAAVSHFCPSCGRIQPVMPSMDYFSFFQLPRRLNIDSTVLERQFYDLSRQFHPDYFCQASEPEREFSMDRTALLNDAYRTLKDPLRRANYLLELMGMRATERKSKTPPDLLAEVFELNEEMEELRAAKRAQAREEVAQLRRRIIEMQTRLNKRAAMLHQQLQENFMHWDAIADTAIAAEQQAVLDQISEVLAHMSYINNLIDSIEEEL